jgi:hypothetical protein
MEATYTKTYKGKSPCQILKDAHVARSGAGIWEIWIKDLGHASAAIGIMDQDGDLVVADSAGPICRIITTPMARRKLQELQALKDAHDQADYDAHMQAQLRD